MTHNAMKQAEVRGFQRRHGFTLVEILIVVVILGILAAIVVPQFANASVSAQSSSMKGSLQVIRSQIELYQAQHDSTYPSLTQLSAAWNVLLSRTDIAGNVGDPPVDGVHVYGPYIKKMPVNPFEDSQTVEAVAAPGVGWVYDVVTAKVYGVMDADKASELNMDTINVVRTYP
jgi:general secretion pathway protein G